jgi:hypothetical protein
MIQQALFEHRFWLQILGDHARFIFNALPPKEAKPIEMANQFITQFDQLLHLARQPDAPTRINDVRSAVSGEN